MWKTPSHSLGGHVKAIDIIGRVGAAALRSRLAGLTDDSEGGSARLILDQLSPEIVAAISHQVLADPVLKATVRIRLPKAYLAGLQLPEEVLTTERTVALRNGACDRPALLLANIEDDQATSLDDVTRVGASELTADPSLWVSAAGSNTSVLDSSSRQKWAAALGGLLSARQCSLIQLAQYVRLTAEGIEARGLSIVNALGWALPELQLPRDTGCFSAIPERDHVTKAKWTSRYADLFRQRAPLLLKKKASGQSIELGDLLSQFEKVQDDLPGHVREAVLSFLGSSPGWTTEASDLAAFEWELDSVSSLFSDVRRRAKSLAAQTLAHFELHDAGALDDPEKQYLRQLDQRRTKQAQDDDREFYEGHRQALGKDKPLASRWERFVYDAPIETGDFLEGLLTAIERLSRKVESWLPGPRKLIIRSHHQQKAHWLSLNRSIAGAFSLRYRGLPRLMQGLVEWQVPEIFGYEELLEWADAHDEKPSTSRARAATQIKFDVEILVGEGGGRERQVVQVVWRGDPDGIGANLFEDARHLLSRPLVQARVVRRIGGAKGHGHALSLADTSTLEALGDREAGRLLPDLPQAGDDIRDLFVANLERSAAAGRLSAQDYRELRSLFDLFVASYERAISAWWSTGTAASELLAQASSYASLLQALRPPCHNDRNRHDLLRPILGVGIAHVDGPSPAAIVPPWHPLRFAAIAAKARYVAGLIQHVLSADEINFGDDRLFFADLRFHLRHPYYPEVVVGYVGDQPELLSCSDTLDDYSLMEAPTRKAEDSSTNEDPGAAAQRITDVVRRYLDLQPHERANLAVALYSCDSAGLPLATVNALSSLHEDEVRCNVVLRHQDSRKLEQLYSELIERTDADSDALVASETSQNFMSKLRVSIMLEGTTAPASAGEKQVDIAFLQDVVARQGSLRFLEISPADPAPTLLAHVPPSWSYKRFASEEEFHATVYLACPQQPQEGWAYLDSVAAVVDRHMTGEHTHRLPARQISFEDNKVKRILDDAHALAEWVVNYDELLDKRQLIAQHINVIRYQREATHGRNLVISSTSEPRVLHVLVKRRLTELALGLPDQQLSSLARALIDRAAAISGDIVLRAARRGVFAGELIGLVLSQSLLAEECGAATAWFFLDDYAGWLGQREGGIADLLALGVEDGPDGSALRLLVSEAKFLRASILAQERRSSRNQVKSTVARLADALFGQPGRLDRDLWLARLSDLLLDMRSTQDARVLGRFRDAIRAGRLHMDLRGYSHVFVWDSDAGSEQESIPDVGLQEVFGRREVRDLLLAVHAGRPLVDVRSRLGDEKPWTQRTWRDVSPRVRWALPPSEPLPPTPSGHAAAISDHGAPDRVSPQTSVAGSPPAATVTPTRGLPSPPHAGEGPSDANVSALAEAGWPAPLATLIASHASRDPAQDADPWLADVASRLRTALLRYSLQAMVLGTRLTPNAGLIRLKGTDRLHLSDIESRQSQLLTTHGLRLISLSAQPGEIVVGVARPTRTIVPLWRVWTKRRLNRQPSGHNLSFVVGERELDGELLYLNLGSEFGGQTAHAPHTLIAGTSGSGKSVLLQVLLLDIAATNLTQQAQIHLIDPKMGVDFSQVARLPHVAEGIITTQEEALALLQRLVDEMERRYRVFVGHARDLQSFNARAAPADRLPAIFVVHDEFADWMQTESYRDHVSGLVGRLGAKARGAGIHLIFAAQRPEALVMPMQLRANLDNRLVLRVADTGTSEISLGSKGAERLLGRGHLLARLAGEPDLIYAQVPFASDEDLELLVDTIRGEHDA
jgi:S-DNA-T family DNA segregation ATPase FtsK/SpoIIIE